MELMTKDMKQQLIKEITDIVAQYTDVMELKFGCRYIDKIMGEKEYTVVFRDDVEDRLGFGKNEVWSVPDFRKGYYADYHFPNAQWQDNEKYDFKIIGRPVTLEDILITIEAQKDALKPYPRHITIDTRGILSAYFTLTDKQSEKWQLGKPLHEQSEETLQFIKDLIK